MLTKVLSLNIVAVLLLFLCQTRPNAHERAEESQTLVVELERFPTHVSQENGKDEAIAIVTHNCILIHVI